MRWRGWHDEPVVLRSVAFVIVRRVLDLIGLGPTPDEKDVVGPPPLDIPHPRPTSARP
jgi:hypothetical protein